MSQPRILLMYITEVSGHHSATLAIEKALRQQSDKLEIANINGFRYTNPISEKIVNRLYTAVIKKTPKIWDYMYDNPAVKKKLDAWKNLVHKFNSPKLKRLVDSFKPDVVVCSQAFPCGMVADFKKTFGLKLPLIGVLTDYVPHSYWVYDTVDYYITPDDSVSQRIIQKGVAKEKIRPFGIPFDPAFNAPVDPKAVRQKLGLDQDKKVILIMGGGQGLGPIKSIVSSLEKAQSDFCELIVCGTNKKLLKSLKTKAKHSRKQIIAFGYINTVNELMSISDLVVTKPGGITTSEALTKKLPMLIIKPIPGQEMNNTVFLTQQGAALRLEKPEQSAGIIDDLFMHPEKLRRISYSCARIAKPDSARDIASFILSLV